MAWLLYDILLSFRISMMRTASKSVPSHPPAGWAGAAPDEGGGARGAAPRARRQGAAARSPLSSVAILWNMFRAQLESLVQPSSSWGGEGVGEEVVPQIFRREKRRERKKARRWGLWPYLALHARALVRLAVLSLREGYAASAGVSGSRKTEKRTGLGRSRRSKSRPRRTCWTRSRPGR